MLSPRHTISIVLALVTSMTATACGPDSEPVAVDEPPISNAENVSINDDADGSLSKQAGWELGDTVTVRANVDPTFGVAERENAYLGAREALSLN